MAADQALRLRLESERKRLEQELALLGSEEQASEGRQGRGSATHVADDASETLDQEQTLALERHVRGLLANVERALRKLDNGTYGCCDYCGRAIESARLEALPYATLCLACQARLEGRR